MLPRPHCPWMRKTAGFDESPSVKYSSCRPSASLIEEGADPTEAAVKVAKGDAKKLLKKALKQRQQCAGSSAEDGGGASGA